jgi:hypothetical protein
MLASIRIADFVLQTVDHRSACKHTEAAWYGTCTALELNYCPPPCRSKGAPGRWHLRYGFKPVNGNRMMMILMHGCVWVGGG